MIFSLLRTDVAAKDELRKRLWDEMAAFGEGNVTKLPGCPERPAPPRESRFKDANHESSPAPYPEPEDGRKCRPQRGVTWGKRTEYQRLVKEHGINLREVNLRAGWSNSYVHGMLRGIFQPSASRIAIAERIITKMIEEKTNAKRSHAPA